MVARRGTSSIGCLTSLIFLGVVAYFGFHVAQPYFRYYQYRDAIAQEARFAGTRTDSAIQQNIWTNADSLALPEDAYHIRIKRTPNSISVGSEYDDTWSVPYYTRPVHFSINITNSL